MKTAIVVLLAVFNFSAVAVTQPPHCVNVGTPEVGWLWPSGTLIPYNCRGIVPICTRNFQNRLGWSIPNPPNFSSFMEDVCVGMPGFLAYGNGDYCNGETYEQALTKAKAATNRVAIRMCGNYSVSRMSGYTRQPLTTPCKLELSARYKCN